MADRLRCHITVAAVIENAGRFLFVEEIVSGVRVLNQPAGHLDPGEDLLQAVMREVREEACLDFIPDAWLGCDLLALPDAAVILRFAFCGQIQRHLPEIARDPQILALHWLTPAQAQADWTLRSPLVLQSIDRYQSGLRLPLAGIGAYLEGQD